MTVKVGQNWYDWRGECDYHIKSTDYSHNSDRRSLCYGGKIKKHISGGQKEKR
jgi:hypothetical protein